MPLSNLPGQLSFSKTLSSSSLSLSTANHPFFLFSNLSLSPSTTPPRRTATIIRMGGGPRTYPGGVSKWQWKRMQAKKAKQLLKARLSRERHIYEMRKRAELQAAVSELERPWEPVRKAAPNLFSVSADEQVKVLADRFQKPGGFDLWTERDGPQLFETPDGIPSARFFPKGVVHSVRPYGKVSSSGFEDLGSGLDGEEKQGNGLGVDSKRNGGEWRKKRGRRRKGSGFGGTHPGEIGKGTVRSNGDRRDGRSDRGNRIGKNGGGLRDSRDAESGQVYDMSMGDDGRYGFEADKGQFDDDSRTIKSF